MIEDVGFIAGVLNLSAGSIVAGIVAAAIFYWLMFKDFETFCDCAKYWLNSNWRNSREGMFSEEWWGQTKIFLWLGLSAGVAYGTNSMFLG